MVRRTWMLPAVLVMLLAGAARAEPEYVYRKPVKGVALVVGNADYSSQTKLPGSLRDADLVAKELQKLGFEVILRTNLRTREQFIEQALEPFWSKIEPNTIVAFYFSGHGFSFGGESYLAPLDFPNSVPYDKTAETFLSATAILDSIAERRPGVMLMVLDACRNMTTIIDTAGDPSNRAQTDRKSVV